MKLLKPAEVATRLDVSLPTLYRMLARGELTVVRHESGRYRIPEDSVLGWLTAHTVLSGADRALEQRATIHALPALPQALSDDGEDLDLVADELGLR